MGIRSAARYVVCESAAEEGVLMTLDVGYDVYGSDRGGGN